ncbi:MAG: hypothetical protein JWL83_479 [Actinomycetia bacterium]|nr:hypothetical protein [Actinomycetes bacterium]
MEPRARVTAGAAAATLESGDGDPTAGSVRRPVQTWCVFAFFAVVALLLFFPSPAKLTTHLPGDGGDVLLNYWTLRWVEHAAPHGWHTLWNTNVFFPATNTLAYSESMFPETLVHWPLATMTRSPVLAFNLVYLAGWTLSGFCTYLVARRFGARTGAALLAGLAYTVASPRLSQYLHFQLSTGWLLPVAVLLAARFVERPTPGRGAALGAAVAVQGLAATYYGVAATISVFVVLAVAFAWERPWRRVGWPALLRGVAGVLLVVGALLAPVAVQYRDLQRDPHFRHQQTLKLAVHTSDFVAVTKDAYLLTHIPPFSSTSRAATHSVENRLFPGVVALALAAIGAAALVRRRQSLRDAPAFVGVLVAAVVLLALSVGDTLHVAGLGIPMPFRLVQHLPGFAGIRATSRLFAMTQLAIALLAAFGAGWVLARVRSRVTRTATVALLACAVLAESAAPVVLVRLPADPRATAVNHVLARLPRAPVAELPVGSPVAAYAWPFVEAPRQVLSTIDWNPRVDGYSGFTPKNYNSLAKTLNTFPSPASLRALRQHRVRYVVLRLALPGPLPRDQQALAGRDGIGFYSATHAQAIVRAIPPGSAKRVERIGDAYLITLEPA